MTELLAPAGDIECFKAALCAGADAIYVGGKKYGARAYAGNFEQEDLLSCLKLAHLHGKKVYLTVNTLIKEQELGELLPFIKPLYEEGLDGVIVQDFGGLLLMKEAFPDLELHASTQMTVTGSRGALLLKENGITRVVPARELSLAEIVEIKQATGLEVETFVHGAMCYGYSGQCLFSSMLGERSGNRGRCAGPCRLPYDISYEGCILNGDNEKYPLSLKDLCTLDILPKLMQAEIDSFKIEGRMKTPEYVSFVTGMYRKYIDLYLSDPQKYRVFPQDRKLLQNKFSRGGVQSGYYFMHNGRELVTLDKPGYKESSLEDVNTKVGNIDLVGQFVAIKNEPVSLTVSVKDTPETTVVSLGNIARAADKCAATGEDVRKQLCKTGNTSFAFCHLDITMDDDLFLPNKELNELRRDALSKTEEMLLAPYRRQMLCENSRVKTSSDVKKNTAPLHTLRKYYHMEVRTLEQLEAVPVFSELESVYLSSDSITALPGNETASATAKIASKFEQLRQAGVSCYVTLPPVCRQKTMKILEEYRNIFKELSVDGFCIGNLESLAYIRDEFPEKKIIAGPGLYLFNSKTLEFYGTYGVDTHILSYELHRKETEEILESLCADGHAFILPVYGYIPVMESAGCVLKTNQKCRNGAGKEQVILTDRHRKQRIVVTHCDRCENTIYNSVPLSLHKETGRIMDMKLQGIMLKFTVESPEEMKRIISCFVHSEIPVSDFTKGHFLKGVE